MIQNIEQNNRLIQRKHQRECKLLLRVIIITAALSAFLLTIFSCYAKFTLSSTSDHCWSSFITVCLSRCLRSSMATGSTLLTTTLISLFSNRIISRCRKFLFYTFIMINIFLLIFALQQVLIGLNFWLRISLFLSAIANFCAYILLHMIHTRAIHIN